MNINLDDQRILVTGASRGIGFAITEQLLTSGADVVAQYRENHTFDQLEDRFGRKLLPVKADLSNTEDVLRLYTEITKSQVHGVVHNAGVALSSSIDKPVQDWISDWDYTMKVNFDAVGIMSKLFIDHFRENKGGRFVFITSRAIHRGDTIEYMAYGASKSGMSNILKTIARSEGKNNIKAFGIAPGFTKTDMAQDFIEEYGESIVKDDIVLENLTTPKDIAPMVAMFLSGKVDHATGSILDINAGSYVR